jgi:DNA ligase 1
MEEVLVQTSTAASAVVALDAKYDGQRAQIHLWRRGRKEGDSGGRGGAGPWQVELFSRHLEAMTDKYPDVVALLPPLLADDVTSAVIDAEVVAVAPTTDPGGSASTASVRFLPFQTLSTRGRKGVPLETITVSVCVCAFDLMLLNGEPLIARPYVDRRALLAAVARPLPGRYMLTELQCFAADESSLDGMRALLHRALATPSCEGVMVKPLGRPSAFPLVAATLLAAAAPAGADVVGAPTDASVPSSWTRAWAGGHGAPPLPATPTAVLAQLDAWATAAVPAVAVSATYEPARRTSSWLKVKKDYVDGVVDSLDLVPIAAWWGNGRKAGWLSPFLLACYNDATAQWEAVCKCISGFPDTFYKEQTAFYLEAAADRASARPRSCYVDDPAVLRPDFWLAPCQVWEIRGADLTLSPTYVAGRTVLGGERGVSLRFPRFVRSRPDKPPEAATSAAEVVRMYRQQTHVTILDGGGGGGDDDEDAWELG